MVSAWTVGHHPPPNWPLAIDINNQRRSCCDSVKLCSPKQMVKTQSVQKSHGKQIKWPLVCQLGPCGIVLRHNSFLLVTGLGQSNPRSWSLTNRSCTRVKSGRVDHVLHNRKAFNSRSSCKSSMVRHVTQGRIDIDALHQPGCGFTRSQQLHQHCCLQS